MLCFLIMIKLQNNFIFLTYLKVFIFIKIWLNYNNIRNWKLLFLVKYKVLFPYIICSRYIIHIEYFYLFQDLSHIYVHITSLFQKKHKKRSLRYIFLKSFAVNNKNYIVSSIRAYLISTNKKIVPHLTWQSKIIFSLK